MNTPLLLTSVALLAGVAARPIENNRRGDDLRDLAHSPESDDRQAFLGRIPSGFGSLNSLQLHDLHDHTQPDGSALDGSRSPKLNGLDRPSDPDPGLSSPYMGPQRYLSSAEQELGSPPAETLISHPSTPPSPDAPRKTEQLRLSPEDPNYSPIVVVLVISSLAALVLLGLTVAVVYASQLLRRTIFQEDVWKSVAGDSRGEKGVDTLEGEKVGQEKKQAVLEGSMDQEVIAAREIPIERLLTFTTDSIKPSESLVEDPDVPSLPGRLSTSSAPTVYSRDRDRNMGLALTAWTYDNWMTHFMMALFGWLGVFFGGTRSQ